VATSPASDGTDVTPGAWAVCRATRERHRVVSIVLMVVCVGLLGILLLIEPVLGLGALAAAFVCWLGLHSTSLSLGLLLLTVPVQDLVSVSVGPTSLTWTKIVVGAAAIAWGLRVANSPELLRFDSIAVLLLAYVAVLLATVVNAQDLGAWAGEVYRWSVSLLVYLMALSAVRERRYPVVLVGTSAMAVVAVSLYGTVQVVTGAGPPSFESHGLTRAFGAFGEPNPLAGYLEMTVPLLVAVAIGGYQHNPGHSRSIVTTRLWLLATGSACVGLLTLGLTQSRGGLLGVASGLTVILLCAGGAWRRLAIGGTVLAMAAFVATPIGPRVMATVGPSSPQQVSPANFAVHERLAHWRTGVAMAQEYPVLGVGAGNFTARYREFAQVWRFRISRGHAHNAYIHAAAQSGLFGLVCYIGLLATVAARLVRSFRHASNSDQKALIAGAIGVTVAVATHGFFDYLHVLSLGIQLSAVWALASIGEVERHEPEH
jgi:O-antigen ligase